MLNRKIFALAAGLLTAITVTGTGFSAWYFSDVQTSANATGRIDVTEIQTLNASVELIDNAVASTNEFKLELDQVNASSDRGKGIRFLSTDGKTMVSNLGAKATITKTGNPSDSVDFGSYFYIPNALLNYLNVVTDDLDLLTSAWSDSITAAANSLGVEGLNSTNYKVYYKEESIDTTTTRNIDVSNDGSDVNAFFTYIDSKVNTASAVEDMALAVESLNLYVVHRTF